MTKKEAQQLLSSWNGEDEKFLHNGKVYHQDDVREAEALLSNKQIMEKIVEFQPASDKTHEDPKKNYGIGGVKCAMVLKGEKGAVHFFFDTGMHLPGVKQRFAKEGKMVRDIGLSDGEMYIALDYMGYDVGYHSPEKQFESQNINQEECEYLDGKPCYTDSSAFRAEKYMETLVREGSDAIWDMLEEDYKNRFKNEKDDKDEYRTIVVDFENVYSKKGIDMIQDSMKNMTEMLSNGWEIDRVDATSGTAQLVYILKYED